MSLHSWPECSRLLGQLREMDSNSSAGCPGPASGFQQTLNLLVPGISSIKRARPVRSSMVDSSLSANARRCST